MFIKLNGTINPQAGLRAIIGYSLNKQPASQFLSCFWVNKKLSQILTSGRSNESIPKP
ncbi:hypothetical protein [Salmonella phage STWB21]|uniref:Uncharacterized protein n=1 Tax=Salmonella phage STWB21 TaxID=2815768 RepID=A0A8A6RGK8_9CAUD|nr:hypothetical protein [Salmonella phage STWB21]